MLMLSLGGGSIPSCLRLCEELGLYSPVPSLAWRLPSLLSMGEGSLPAGACHLPTVLGLQTLRATFGFFPCAFCGLISDRLALYFKRFTCWTLSPPFFKEAFGSHSLKRDTALPCDSGGDENDHLHHLEEWSGHVPAHGWGT